ncbi:hypothetical protein [Polaribacter sp. BAL334]|nr:hypothetical protein [Polaribacter sp. BAL334]
MSKLDEKVALYKKFMDDRDIRSNTELLAAVTKGLGPYYLQCRFRNCSWF